FCCSPRKSVALAALARRATGCRRTLCLSRRAAFRFARLGILRASSISGEGSAPLKCSRNPRQQKRVLPLRGSGRNHAGVVGLSLWISVILRLWLSMTSPADSDNILAARGGERRLLALMNLNEEFRSSA
ncbi:MAG: hypothetical protein WAN81_23325, partial [Candidatus Binataceae bacterium]